MGIEAHVFEVHDETLIATLNKLTVAVKRLEELGYPFPLPKAGNLYFNPDNFQSSLPQGPILLLAGWYIGSVDSAKKTIVDYLNSELLGVSLSEKFEAQNLFAEKVVYKGHFSGDTGRLTPP